MFNEPVHVIIRDNLMGFLLTPEVSTIITLRHTGKCIRLLVGIY